MEDFSSYADYLRRKTIDRCRTVISEVNSVNESSLSLSQTAIPITKVIDSNAYNPLTMRDSSLNRKRMQLDLFQLVWLASDSPMFNIENNSKTFTFENFRACVDKTMVFNNVEQCLLCLQQSEKDGIITFLVCCDSLAQMLIPQLTDYESIRSAYVLCQNQNKQLQSVTKNFTARTHTRKIFETLETLVLDLSKTLNQLKQHEDNLALTQIRSKFDDEVENTTDKQWSWWIKFIEILIHLPYPVHYCRQKFDLLKEFYVGNPSQINFIHEFQTNYQSHDSIRWYSRDTCLYRLLNQALRKHNVELLFLFGYFVQDLYRQLTHEYKIFRSKHSSNSIITVYRGQIMSRNEIEELAGYRLAINNSFFSTTLDRHLATFFLNPLAKPDEEMQSVLFQIKLDCKLQSRPFANISHLSNFQTEDEILFMVGTLFEVGDVVYDETEHIWLIQLELLYDENIKDTRDFESKLSPRRTLKNCISKLTTFILPELGESEIQTIIFEKLMELFPKEDKWFSASKLRCQSEHLRLYDEEESFNEILTNYEQAIKIWQDYLGDEELNCSIELGQLHFGIGEYYTDQIHNHEMAEKYLDLAVNHYLSALEKEHNDYQKMKIYDEISIVFQLKMKPMMIDDEDIYENSLEKEQAVSMTAKYKELYIEYMAKFYPSNYIEIGRTHNYLAYLYKSIGKFENTLLNYEKALNSFLQNSHLPSNDVKFLIEEIVYFYSNDLCDYQTALRYQLVYHEYIVKMAKMSNFGDIDRQKKSIADSHIELADIYSSLHQINLASENLTVAMNLYAEIDENAAESAYREKKITSILEKMTILEDTSISDQHKIKIIKKENA